MAPLTLAFIAVFVAITVIPLLSKKIRLPVIVIEILFGMAIGKSLFDIIPEHTTIDFFSSFGLVYLMFIAGLEINFESVKRYLSRTISITLFSLSIPFLTGVMLASSVGMPPLLVGVIFSTTSLGLILPLSREFKYKEELLSTLVGSVILVDTLSMFLLAFTLAFIEGSMEASFLYSLLAIMLLFVAPWLIGKLNIHEKTRYWSTDKTYFSTRTRFSFALIFVLVAISEELGFHSIIGAFIAGLIISELTPEASVLEKKLEGFGYGFFIPLFFIFTGAKVDIPTLFSNIHNVELLIVIVSLGMISKVAGVSVVSWLVGFNSRESVSLGLFHSARLSLIIATIEIGRRLGLIKPNLFAIFILLAITSALIGPSLGKYVLSAERSYRAQ